MKDVRRMNKTDRANALAVLREMVGSIERQGGPLVANFYRAAHQFHYSTANSADACTVGKARLFQTMLDLAQVINWPPPAANEKG